MNQNPFPDNYKSERSPAAGSAKIPLDGKSYRILPSPRPKVKQQIRRSIVGDLADKAKAVPLPLSLLHLKPWTVHSTDLHVFAQRAM